MYDSSALRMFIMYLLIYYASSITILDRFASCHIKGCTLSNVRHHDTKPLLGYFTRKPATGRPNGKTSPIVLILIASAVLSGSEISAHFPPQRSQPPQASGVFSL
ncbi:hypothetical protein GcM1_212059 [Golovinomyces cichoracearum]|uniref:Uncharacterized protein n=1 Tax=Golovinomyces cichoracearum TaxID=62708 RepID=A0A420IV04_9PEZI|nr:hypothetical protein GcM1_212059 [Golovinomyces cichoracearum]